jgi:hypothetical protein
MSGFVDDYSAREEIMAEQIPITELIVGRWYVGRGRRGNVALWDETRFLTIAEKFGELVIKGEFYYTEDSGTFQPFAPVDEGVMVEPFGSVGWTKHYGRRIEFGIEHAETPPSRWDVVHEGPPANAVGAEMEDKEPESSRR